MTTEDALFTLPASPPPALARLRAEYAEAVAAWHAADEHEDESGEAVPHSLVIRRDRAEQALLAEEARLAALPDTSHCAELGVAFAELPHALP
jgi:hypothetical protein